MINLRNAGVRFASRWIFRHLELSMASGTSLALLGPNGRGKTTLIRTLIGTQPLSEGRREAPALIGYVPQIGAPAAYRVLDMVVMGLTHRLGIFGSPTKDHYRSACGALELVGLAALANEPFNLISGGERQLVLIARALATGARTIVLDEPASALDLANQHRLVVILNELRESGSYTIIFSTHLPQHALLCSDEAVLLLPQGEVARGATSTILNEAILEQTYNVPVRRIPVAGQADAIVPLLGAHGTAELTSRFGSKHHG
ncbi:ABC transporter ATP-binding protein [Ensifer adhaerens]|uniref:ABC transporter ATP-binding protein n=1 Tax=Ensifer adhaerens TaxID=106592 RepID=UPI003CFF9918